MTIQKIKAGRVTQVEADEWVGPHGTLFYNEDLGDLRVGDGVTPGGILLAFGGTGDGGTYTLPTATTTTKGGVKIDGSTITIANQVISVGTVPYNKLSGAPTIPTDNNQLANSAGYITSSALTGLATESYVTNRGYITSSSLTGLATESYVTTQGYITSSALSGYATESYVTNRGYITSSSLTGLATETFVTTQGYITSAALSGYALTTAIPTDISDLTDNSGLLGQGGGGGGTTVITNNIENPFSFSVAGDDSTLREISNGESIKFTGAGGIAITTDDEGNVTVTGTPVSLEGYATESYVTTQGYITSAALTGLATESYVTSRGYITGLSWDQLTDKPSLAGTYTFSIAGDDSTLREIANGESVKFIGAGGITTSSDAEGNITITGVDAPAAVISATAPELDNGAVWYNSTDGRTYVRYNDLWVDANPPVVPEVSTYLDGLVIEGTTITTVSYVDTDIKIHDLTFKDTGVIQLPLGGDIVDSTGASVLGSTSGPSDRLVAGDNSVILDTYGELTLPNGSTIGSNNSFSGVPITTARGTILLGNSPEIGLADHFHIMKGGQQALSLFLGDDSNYVKLPWEGGVEIATQSDSQYSWTFGTTGVLTLPNGSTIGDGDPVFGVPITTARGSILLGNQAECAGGESHFHIMKAGQQAIDLFLGDDNNYVKLPSTGGVEISSSEIGSQHYWTFGGDGVLRMPDGNLGGDGRIDFSFEGYNWARVRSHNRQVYLESLVDNGPGDPANGNILTQLSVGTEILLITDWENAQYTWKFDTDGTLIFPDLTVQTTAWLGVFSYNDLTDKPNLAGTYTWSIAADDSSQLEIGTGNLVKIQGAGGITTALDADGNITVTGAPGIIVSATAPTDALAKQWYNSTDGRTYVKYNDLWVDANPPVVPEVSTYLDGLVVEGTTITTVSYADTDIKIHDLIFTDNGVIQLPLGGDIVDSLGNSVLGVSGITFEYSRLQEGLDNDNPITSITGLNETGLSLTSNRWAQLMWVPDITTVTLNDIDDGGNTYTWAYTDDSGFTVENRRSGSPTKTWVFKPNGTTEFPNYTFPSADGAANQVLKTDGNGNLTWTDQGTTPDRLTSNTRSAVLNSNGTFSLPTLTAAPADPQAGQMALADGVSWNPLSQTGTSPYMVIYTGTGWLGLGGGVTMDQVYDAILELG
jgi:hypothetical protein